VVIYIKITKSAVLVKVLKFVISIINLGVVVKETHLIGSALTVLEIPINKIKNIFEIKNSQL
jgi:hypothetical protein